MAEAEHGDLEGRHHVRDSEVDEPLSAMMKDYTDRVTDAMQEMGAHAAAAPEVAAQVAEHTARLISKQTVSRAAWKWLAAVVVLVTVVNLGASALAWNHASESMGRASQVAATQAAWTVIYQRSQSNVTQIRTQIDTINKQLIAQGKPPVPLPSNPADASAQLSYAKTELLLVPQVIEGPRGKEGKPGLPGQPPLSWTSRWPDGSIETCLRATRFDPLHPNYACSVTATAARVPVIPR